MNSIYSYIDLFVTYNILSEENAWYCPNCKEFVQASRKIDLWKLPEILIIHIQRFCTR